MEFVMPQFFVKQENIKESAILITDKSDINHILNVLRYRKNDNLILTAPDNKVFEVVIKSANPDIIECEVMDSFISDKILKLNITLAQSIIKSQKQDFLIQKATELGIREIIPLVSKNTVVKFDSEKDKLHKIQRWQKIVYESSKQCQRGDIAKITEIIDFSELEKLVASDKFSLIVLCSEKKADTSIKQFLTEHKSMVIQNPNILVIIGPEGGWDDTELEKFINKGITPLTLGKLILRAETAVIMALSQIIYELE